MTYSLYYAENSAAMGVRVLLEELNQPYTLIPTSIDMDTPRPPELLALNPKWLDSGSGEQRHRHLRMRRDHHLAV